MVENGREGMTILAAMPRAGSKGVSVWIGAGKPSIWIETLMLSVRNIML